MRHPLHYLLPALLAVLVALPLVTAAQEGSDAPAAGLPASEDGADAPPVEAVTPADAPAPDSDDDTPPPEPDPAELQAVAAEAEAQAREQQRTELEAAQTIARRFRDMPGMENVTVTVQGGTARLAGEVVDVESRLLAEQVAGRQEGVQTVENRITLSTNLGDRLNTAMRQVMDRLIQLVAALPVLAVAIAIVVLGWWVGKLLGRRAGHRQWRGENPYTASLVQRFVTWATMLVALLIALDLLGATAVAGAVLGSAGVIGLVIGFAFKDIAENYVAGVLLSLRRPFAPGEALRIDSYDGTVAALTSRTTVLVTADGNQLNLPNALVFKSVVLNFSRNPNRRFDFVIPIDGCESLVNAQEVAIKAIACVDGVLTDPAPSWTVQEYDGNAVRLQFFGWINQRGTDLGKARSAAIHAVRTRFAEAGILDAPRSIQYIARLPGDDPARDRTPDVADQALPETSVNRELDAQVEAERLAHANVDLIGSEKP
ncbi:mechanosensitive ion channel [Lysobacter sp. GX 14042]|uniref:mechanosensitive ion channel domain-containing protein n=1 Tax=Lysobacter sp. GX 14042 TaxID=2907155 RepID=UPI001F2FA646|nr:mechanosensitive ion channel domain-containing protein [Lysobacter sp. GX 14042]MCE7031531.1 mechanosensitive ion channel [Lysobacter sp. GX 14042]